MLIRDHISIVTYGRKISGSLSSLGVFRRSFAGKFEPNGVSLGVVLGVPLGSGVGGAGVSGGLCIFFEVAVGSLPVGGRAVGAPHGRPTYF